MGSIEHEIEAGASAQECYTWWRNLTNLGEIMDEVIEVRALDATATHTHWIVEGPLGMRAEWDAVLVAENEPEMLSWKSVKSSLESCGSVHFVSRGESTLVRVELEWQVPGGGLGELVAKTLSSPRRRVEHAMESFKNRIEAAGQPVLNEPTLEGRGGAVRNELEVPTIVETRASRGRAG